MLANAAVRAKVSFRCRHLADALAVVDNDTLRSVHVRLTTVTVGDGGPP